MGRDTLGRNIGGYVDPPWMAAIRAQSDRDHLARAAQLTLTLGQLQEALKPYPPELPVEFRGCGLDGKVPNCIDSWRGAYSDLALDPSGPATRTTVHELLQILDDALGREFEGFKGGTFDMDPDTPVWVDEWGGYTGDRGLAAVRPLMRQGQAVAVLLVVQAHGCGS